MYIFVKVNAVSKGNSVVRLIWNCIPMFPLFFIVVCLCAELLFKGDNVFKGDIFCS